jgi:hypothetical protein
MIIWLASYPRSGNTLLRLLCWKVFGIDSSTIYFSANNKLQLNGFVNFNDHNELYKAWFATPEMVGRAISLITIMQET